MQQYVDLVKHIERTGVRKENRTGVDTLACFGYHYSVDVSSSFPLLTTKKMSWKNIVIENLWFLGKNSSPTFLHKHGVHFWDAWIEYDAYDNTQKLPEAYGEYWRKYPYWSSFDGLHGGVTYFDQFQAIIDELRRNPNSRRLVLTNWYPPSAWLAKLPPCHLLSIFNVINGELSLHLTQRSCDVALGVPYNLAGYAFILYLMGQLTGIKPGVFSHTLVDAHIYVDKPDGSMAEYNHLPGLLEQIQRPLLKLPNLKIDHHRIRTLEDVDTLIQEGTTEEILACFKLEDYVSHPAVKFKVAV